MTAKQCLNMRKDRGDSFSSGICPLDTAAAAQITLRVIALCIPALQSNCGVPGAVPGVVELFEMHGAGLTPGRDELILGW